MRRDKSNGLGIFTLPHQRPGRDIADAAPNSPVRGWYAVTISGSFRRTPVENCCRWHTIWKREN